MTIMQVHLFLGLHLLRLHLLHFPGEHGLGLRGGVDAVRLEGMKGKTNLTNTFQRPFIEILASAQKPHLDGDDEVATVLEEELGVEGDNPGLVRLGDVSEDAVDHGDEHAVLVGVPRVLDDRHHVRPLLRHVQQVAARPDKS